MKTLLTLAVTFMLCSITARAAEKDFWIVNTAKFPPEQQLKSVEMRAEKTLSDGTSVVFWLEKGLNEKTPNDEAINDLVFNLTKDAGPLEIEKRYLGEQPTPPSQDRTVHFVLTAMPPLELMGLKVTFDGFVSSFDLFRDEDIAKVGQHSNERDVVYLNALNVLNSAPMRVAAVREFGRLLTERGKVNSRWLQDVLIEAGLELAGFSTNEKLLQDYLSRTFMPVASDVREPQGSVVAFAQFLQKRQDPLLLRALIDVRALNPFEKFETAYRARWADSFADYAQWLFELNPAIAAALVDGIDLPATGLVYFSKSISTQGLVIDSAPHACARSKNEIKTREVKSAERQATAVWVESTPPCAAVTDRRTKKLEAFHLVM